MSMDFTFKQGEIESILVTLSDDAGDPIDLNGYEIEVWIEDGATKTEGSGITIIDAEEGEFSVSIDANDTAKRGRFPIEIWIIDAGIRERAVDGVMSVRGSVRNG